MKKFIFTGFIIMLILSVGAVSAENSTDAAPLEINDTDTIETEKTDLKFDVDFPEELNKHYDGDGPYFDIINAADGGEYQVYFDGVHSPDYDFYGLDNYHEIGASRFSLGMHNVTIAFLGNELYNPANVTKTFSVVDVSIRIPKGDTNVDLAYAQVNLPKDATGYVTVKLDNKQIKKIDVSKVSADGALKYVSQNLNTDMGKHVVEVIYSGDKKYSKVSKKSEFNIVYDIYIENPYLTYGLHEIISIVLPNDITENLIVEIDGKNYSAKYDKKDEAFKVNITNLGLGTHNVTMTYNGDAKYGKNTVKSTLEVTAKMNIPSRISYGDGHNISLKLPKDAKGNLTVYLSRENWINKANESLLYGNIEMVNGCGEIDISNLKVGDYYYFAEYTGDDYPVSDAFTNGRFSVYPRVVMPRQMNYGDDEYLQVFTNPDFDKKIRFIFLDDEYERKQADFEITPINGTGNCSLKNLPIKLMYASISYDNELVDYEPMINVKGVEPKLTATQDISMYYNDGSKFSVKLYWKDGKIAGAGHDIYFKIGSSTYQAQTNSKGIATITLKETPGKYTITTIYKKYRNVELVSDEYGTYYVTSNKDIKVSNKLVVKQVLTLKSVKVKKSAKKLTLQATLKNKKVIKNKQVTFKFNGKTYKAKTNSKGIAKVTIPKSVLTKLKAGKKVTYQATYGKDTVKKTVKVQK